MAQLSSRYAAALFELSLERGLLNEYVEQAMMLRDLLSGEQCQQIITHPRINAKQKRSFFSTAFSGHVNDDFLGFLNLAVDKNREMFIVPVLTEFISLGNEHNRKATAYVVTAVPLKDKQASALVALLSKKLEKQVEIKQKVNPDIIGGLYVQVDGFYIDRTVKARLRDLKNDLYENVEVV